MQVCARFNGGANAGHTLLVASWLCGGWSVTRYQLWGEDGKKYAFHLLPCGMINKAYLNIYISKWLPRMQACKNLIGNGVVVSLGCDMEVL